MPSAISAAMRGVKPPPRKRLEAGGLYPSVSRRPISRNSSPCSSVDKQLILDQAVAVRLDTVSHISG